jgi:hypothetical protein
VAYLHGTGLGDISLLEMPEVPKHLSFRIILDHGIVIRDMIYGDLYINSLLENYRGFGLTVSWLHMIDEGDGITLALSAPFVEALSKELDNCRG